jgi:hypothetical protein
MSRAVDTPPTVVTTPRCLVVWAGVTSTALLLGVCLADAALALPRTVSRGAVPGAVDESLVSIAALVLLGCAGWVWLVASAAIVEAWRHGAVTPAGGGVRRLVLLACGAAVAAGVAAPATAVDERAPDRSAVDVLEGLRLPERASTPATGARPAAVGPAGLSAGRERAHEVVVRPGDSLWHLAEQALPVGADAAEVDAAWRRLHARNREVVGPDPDLILPGQRLVLPRRDPGSTDPAHRE